jgi:uncharacterized protein YndB with AHSA1/START domain
MPVTDVHKDQSNLTLSVTTELDAPPEQAWELWSDPRKLERWWGPPGWPATFVEHDLSPGGRVGYFMKGPDGERAPGFWQVVAAHPPASLEFVSGFADDSGAPRREMPTSTMSVSMVELGERRTRMTIRTTFPSAEAMERFLEMGMEEGLSLAVGQMDAIVAGVPAGRL